MISFRTLQIFLQVLFISTCYLSFRIHCHQQQKFNHEIPNFGDPRHHFHDPMSAEFLHAHNLIRAKYGMPPLKWNQTLAEYAYEHGSKLIGNCSMVHSIGKYGENLFYGKLHHWTPTRIVENWAQESLFFNFKAGKCATDWTQCGHFTQVVWADTVHVGCHRLKCIGLNKGYIGICNYDPPGNLLDQRPFVRKSANANAIG